MVNETIGQKIAHDYAAAQVVEACAIAIDEAVANATRRTGKVSESIWNGKSLIIPLADVQHIEKSNELGLIVVTKHTRWDMEADVWANNIWIDKSEAESFQRAWCDYRAMLEADTLMDHHQDQPSRESGVKDDKI